MKPGSTLDKLLTALTFFGGFAAVCFGLWQIYPPSSWIFGGLSAVALTVAGMLPQRAARAAAK